MEWEAKAHQGQTPRTVYRELWTLLEDLELYPPQALHLLSLVFHSVKPFSQQTYTVQPSLPLPGGSAVHSILTSHPCNSCPQAPGP